MKAILSFLLLVFVLGFWSETRADSVDIKVCPEDPLKNAACELYLEAERRLGDMPEAAYEGSGVVFRLFRPSGDFILFVPVPKSPLYDLARFRVFYLARNNISARWHDGFILGIGPRTSYFVSERPLPGATEAVDQKTAEFFLGSLKEAKEIEAVDRFFF